MTKLKKYYWAFFLKGHHLQFRVDSQKKKLIWFRDDPSVWHLCTFSLGEPPFFGVCPKKVILFWSLPSRNTQEYDEADDEEDSPHQGQRGDLVQAGEVLKILKYVNAMEAWDEHQYQFCQTMNSNFIFWSISWRCTELPKSLQFKIKIKWTQNEKVDKNKKYCLKKYFNFVDCTLNVDFSNLPFDMKPG